MSSDKLHTDHLNQLLRKLTAGTLTEAERWSLERASLDDPFLADAIEGYYTEGVDRLSEVAKLKAGLPKKQTSKSRRLMPWKWMSVAACLFVLVGLSFWMYNSPMDQLQHTSAVEAVKENKNWSASANSTKAKRNDSKSPIVPRNEGAARAGASPTAAKNSEPTPARQNVEKRTSTQPATPIIADTDMDVSTESLPQRESARAPAKEAMVIEEEPEDTALKKSESKRLNDVVGTTTKAKKKKEVPATAAPRTSTINKTSEEEIATVDMKMESSDITSTSSIERQKTSTPAVLPKNTVQLISESGQALPGVEILDMNNNSLGNSDREGNFHIPQEQPYVIAAFAGYDSLTIASAPNLSVAMQSSSETFSQPHMRLVDQMDDAEVIRFYTNKLNDIFSRYWPLCTERSVANDFFTGVSIYLTVEKSGNLAVPEYIRDLDPACKEKISQVLRIAQEQQIFYSARPVRFMYRVNI